MKKPKASVVSRAQIFEVGPRDGLQSEKKIFSVEERFELVRRLAAAGLPRIEVGSFVRADRIPQLAETGRLLKRLHQEKFPHPRPEFWTFVPNERGLEEAISAGVDGVSFFIATSETFCQKNVNRSQAELLAELKKLLPQAKRAKIKMRIYVSTLVYCPYEGNIAPTRVAQIVRKLIAFGAQEIVLSDTTGHANPRSLAKVLNRVLPLAGARRLALHMHDTRGLALANVLEGLRHGISIFDSSVGGLGGCPYAPGASGNLASEDLVNMLLGMGLLKKVDLGKLGLAARFAENILGRQVPSKVLRTLE